MSLKPKILKYKTNDVKEKFLKFGWNLLEEYTGNRDLLKVTCITCHKTSHVSLNHLSRKICHYCKKINKQREISSYFNQHNCTLLSEYKHSRIPLSYICHCGEIGLTRLNHFQRGDRCGKCHPRGRTKEYTLEEARNLFKDNNCELLSTEYINIYTPMPYRCKCGEIGKKTLKSVVRYKSHCKKCAAKKHSGENSFNWNPNRTELKEIQKMANKCRNMVNYCFDCMGKIKNEKSYKLLGYNPEQLHQHIRNHPNYESVKNKEWEIDHIFPIYAFMKHNITDIKIINTLDNLQPLLKIENQIKNNKYDITAFKEWLLTKGIEIII